MPDEKDRKILKLLKGNARMTYQELGEALGISRVAAKKRVRKLEEAGVIRGYNTCIYEDEEVRGFIDVETTAEKFDAMLRYVSTRTEGVRQIFSLHKRNHFLMIVHTPTLEALRYMANTIARQDGVIKVTVDIAAEIVKDVYGGVRRYESEWEPQAGNEGSGGSIGSHIWADQRRGDPQEARGEVPLPVLPDEVHE